MNISCERPYALFAILIIIPVLIIIAIHNRKANYASGFSNTKGSAFVKRLFNIQKMIFIRSLFIALAWCMLVLAYAKISWGTYLMPVQKNGTAVSFVFDISNSMLAKDGPEKNTRLKAASIYVQKLLDNMEGIPCSIVLAKGDGVVAIPLTEDKLMIEGLLEVLSPSLMTVPGSSIGKGILKAKETFPSNYGAAGRIWVLTDGEETDGTLKNALSECVKVGIPVSIVGFGSEKETEVLAGDGKTLVKTFLHSEKINKTIEDLQKSMHYYKSRLPVTFINSNESGSAIKLLNQIKTDGNQIISYEAKPVPRYKLFLLLAFLFFAFSYIFTEFDFLRLFRESKSMLSVCVFAMLLGSGGLFSACSSKSMQVLKGSYAAKQHQYPKAVAAFYKAFQQESKNQDSEALEYIVYDLGTAYSLLGENEAAREKFSLIEKAAKEESPKNVIYATYYNQGVIAHKEGRYEEALDYFKKALETDSSKIDAKINMELSIRLVEEEVKHKESKTIPASEDKTSVSDMEKSLFERIKENDKKQWKNSESNQTQNLAEDY